MEKEAKTKIIRYLDFLENELSDFNSFKQLSFEEYSRDKHKRRDVERWIENLLNTVINLSRIIIAIENKVLSDTYKDIVASLSLHPNFNEENMKKLASYIILRNIISYQYLDLKWDDISNFIQTSEEIFKEFVKEVKEYLNKET